MPYGVEERSRTCSGKKDDLGTRVYDAGNDSFILGVMSDYFIVQYSTVRVCISWCLLLIVSLLHVLIRDGSMAGCAHCSAALVLGISSCDG